MSVVHSEDVRPVPGAPEILDGVRWHEKIVPRFDQENSAGWDSRFARSEIEFFQVNGMFGETHPNGLAESQFLNGAIEFDDRCDQD